MAAAYVRFFGCETLIRATWAYATNQVPR